MPQQANVPVVDLRHLIAYINFNSFVQRYKRNRLMLSCFPFLNCLQPNLLDSQQQLQLQQALQQQHLLDQIPATTAESGDNMGRGGGRGSDPLGDEFESKSGSENVDGVSVDDQDPNQRPSKKKRYHRHTQHQIQEMEAYVMTLVLYLLFY